MTVELSECIHSMTGDGVGPMGSELSDASVLLHVGRRPKSDERKVIRSDEVAVTSRRVLKGK